MNRDTVIDVALPESPFSGDQTYSTLFLPPLFDLQIGGRFSTYLLNCYLEDAGLFHIYLRPLFLLVQVGEITEEFRELEQHLLFNPNFRYYYIVGKSPAGKLLVMYVFECPDTMTRDYDRFITGRYSKYSPDAKERFPKALTNQQGFVVESTIWGVINKSKTVRKKIEKIIGEKLEPNMEYFQKPLINREVFRYHQNLLPHEPFEIKDTEAGCSPQKPT